MHALVIDSSIALGFVLKDEQEPRALRARELIQQGVPTFVPSHWCVEVANGLMMAERRKRATQARPAARRALREMTTEAPRGAEHNPAYRPQN